MAESSEVFVMRQARHEHEACRIDAVALRRGAQAIVAVGGSGQQPQHRVGNAAQHRGEAREHRTIELVAVVETHEDGRCFRQPAGCARRRFGDDAGRIGRLEATRQPRDRFGELRAQRGRQHEAIGDHVVDPRCTRGARIREPVDLQWRGPQRERLGDAAIAPAAQVDERVEIGRMQAARDRLRCEPGDDVPVLRRRAQAIADRTFAVAAGREQFDLHVLAAQRLEQRNRQQAGRMIAESVRREADAQPRVRAA